MFLLSLLGLGAICAAEKIHDIHNCNTYEYKGDYKRWARDQHRHYIQWLRENQGEEAVQKWLKQNGLD